MNKDYGYDVSVNTFDENGFIEGGSVLIQLKASETLTPDADDLHFAFDLDLRDYVLWKDEPNPVFLILNRKGHAPQSAKVRSGWDRPVA